MESFRSNSTALFLTAFALTMKPALAAADERQHTVTLVCPGDYPEPINSDTVQPSNECRTGVLEIRCKGPQISGAPDISPDPIIERGKKTGISFPVALLAERAIQIQCKGEKSGRSVFLDKPRAPKNPPLTSDTEAFAKDRAVQEVRGRAEMLNQQIQAAYSPYKALAIKVALLKEQTARLEKKAKMPAGREKLEEVRRNLADAEIAFTKAKTNLAAKQQESEKVEDAYRALLEVKLKERESTIAREKAGLKNLPDAEATKVAEAQAATEKPAEAKVGILRSIGAGAEASLFSSGDRMVGLPGFFAKGELGILPNPKAAFDVEAGFIPLAQEVTSSSPVYLPRNPGQKLEGGMINIIAGVSGKIWRVLRAGVGAGAGLIWIEEGRDVGVSRKSDEQGRRALANVPALLALHPLARVELEIAFDIRDDISFALGGRGTWTLSPLQTEAGAKDNDRVPLINASAFAAAQYHFH